MTAPVSNGNRAMGGHLVLGVALAALAVLGLMGTAWANMTISTPEFGMTTMGSYAGVILTALAGIWLVRKFIKTTNRS